MASKTSSVRGLGRLAGEAAAIFVGVGAALAGQAWFEGRAERIAEVEYLQGVLQEVEVVERIGSDGIEHYEQQRLVSVELVELLAGPVETARSDSIAELAPGLMWYLPGVRSLESIEKLLEPQRLDLVSDAALRRTLTEFRTAVDVAHAVVTQNNDFVLTEVRAVGLEHFDLRGDMGFWADEPAPPPPSRFRRDGAALAGDPAFEALVDLSIVQYRSARSALVLVLELMPEVRGAVHERLAAL